MFETRAILITGSSNHFDLVVYVQVPTTCYRAGALKPGPLPPGVSGLRNIEYYHLTIEHHDHGLCGQIVHDVSATQPNITLPAGKDAICVLALLDGAVVGTAIVKPPADNLADFRRSLTPAASGHTIVPSSVSATVIGGIIGPPRLEVSCMAITPTPGYTAKLQPMKPQGFNPAILILQLILTPPKGPVIEVVSSAIAHFTEPNYRGHYTDVSIVFGNQIVTVPIHIIVAASVAKLDGGKHVRELLPA
jgi:hypothetical protein